jgi:hypothetical protein
MVAGKSVYNTHFSLGPDVRDTVQQSTTSGTATGTLPTASIQNGFYFLGALEKVREATMSFVMSVRPSACLSASNNSALSGRIFMKFAI